VPIAVVGQPHKVAVAREFGADVAIDKSVTSLWDEVKRVAPNGLDVVLDPNGAETLGGSYEHLRPTGRLIIYGFGSMLGRGKGRPNWSRLIRKYLATPRFQPLRMTNENKSVMAFNLSYLFDSLPIMREALDELYRWFEQGRIAPLPIKTYALEDVASAQRALETGETTGKLVLVPDASEVSR
jgi:NADPH:quinone reductase-like Zn-dependent oxidoreductase